MNKRMIRILAAAIVALALVLGGLPLFSQVFYGRSLRATMLAWQFHKDTYTTEEAFEAYLDGKREENAAPYYLPDDAKITVPVEQRVYGDMPVFLLNAREAPETLIVYYPGGSYIDQPRATHWTFLSMLAEDTGAMIAVPIYPKLPENDAQTAYNALTSFYDTLLSNQSFETLVFMGDSAGGGMALSFAMQLRDEGTRGPDKLILLCPWVDVTMTNTAIPAHEKKDPALDAEILRQLGVLWAGRLDPADPVVSPLYGDLTGLGEICFFTTDGELLYPDLVELETALTAAGAAHTMYPQPHLFHGWPLYAYMNIPEAKDAYAQIVSLLTS